MSKVKHRDRKQQKTAAHATHGVAGGKKATLEMQGEVASLMPMADVASAPTARKKEKRYGHN